MVKVETNVESCELVKKLRASAVAEMHSRATLDVDTLYSSTFYTSTLSTFLAKLLAL